MKLKKFKEKNKKKKFIIIFTIGCILILSGIYFYTSFAVFSEEKNFNVINGSYQDPGDLYFAVYVDGEITNTFPLKDSGYYFEKGNCTNGVTIHWNNYAWKADVDYGEYNASDGMATRVKCSLNFKKSHFSENVTACGQAGSSAANCIVQNIDDNPIELLYDNTADNNIRYVGKNPNNYIYYNNELWRIIGVMNNVENGSGLKESRLKIIRDNYIGSYSWDTSNENAGHGINEWSQSDVMKLLNPGYEGESVGGSLYYNRKNGSCYTSLYNGNKSCDFTATGLTTEAKSLFTSAVWNTGSNGNEFYYDRMLITDFYSAERSNNNGKICTNNSYCNDQVARNTKWTGYVGLIYPSDYGYATSGGENISRDICLNEFLHNLNNWKECYQNNWLSETTKWTMTPHADKEGSYTAFYMNSNGSLTYNACYDTIAVFPVVYLKSNVRIIGGTGKEDNPYILGA